LEAFIFWDAKRPITIDILKRLDLVALARELGAGDAIEYFLSAKGSSTSFPRQLALFT